MRSQLEEYENDVSIPTERPSDFAGPRSSSRLAQNGPSERPLREFDQVASRPGRKLRLTGYRLLCISTLVAFGVAKGVTSYQGKAVISNTLDIAFGVGISAVLLIVGYIYEDRVVVWPWLFKTDYAPKIIHVLRQIIVSTLRPVKTVLGIHPLVAVGTTLVAFGYFFALLVMPTFVAAVSWGHWRHDENEAFNSSISKLFIVLSVADLAVYVSYGTALFCWETPTTSKCGHAQSVAIWVHVATIFVCFIMVVLRVLHYYWVGKKTSQRLLPK